MAGEFQAKFAFLEESAQEAANSQAALEKYSKEQEENGRQNVEKVQ